MPHFLKSKSLYYDDVNLIAQPQNKIKSRSEVPKELERIFVAPMQAVVGKTFALEAYRLGLSVCLHRFCDIQDEVESAKVVFINNGSYHPKRLWASIGLNDEDRLIALSPWCRNILIDVANCYLAEVVEYSKKLQDRGFNVMVGNCHTSKGLNLYDNVSVRVGISSGSACQTKDVTGVNRGQITEIIECYEHRKNDNLIIVADGGVKNAGCAAKAFAAGANGVMLGGYFARAQEAQTIIDKEYKFWGGASHLQQLKHKGKISKHSEGKEHGIELNEVKPLEELVSELWGGISSYVSYSGFPTLTDAIGEGIFEIKK